MDQENKNRNIPCFPISPQIVDDSNISENLNNEIVDYLKSVYSEFESYFPEINTESIQMRLARNLFIIMVHDIPDEMEINFLVL